MGLTWQYKDREQSHAYCYIHTAQHQAHILYSASNADTSSVRPCLSRMRVPIDGQGQAPVVTATASPVSTLSQPLPVASAMPAPIQVPLAGLEVSSSSSTTPSAPPLTAAAEDRTKNSSTSSSMSDRPDGPAVVAGDSENTLPAANTAKPEGNTATNTLTNGSSISASAASDQPDLPAQPPATLNANAVNATGEAEHAARVEQEAKIETAILAADDQVKQEQQDEKSLSRQRTPLTDLSLAQTNGTLSNTATDAAAGAAANTAESTPRSPPSPSSTSALSSVTASVAPSVINHNQSSTKDTAAKEEEESSEHADSDRKPRSTGGRSTTARRAASNANLKETAAAAASSSTSSSSTRRSEKPPSTSSNSRTRGASAQGQPQRQSSRSKTTINNGSSTASSSNTRSRVRQRGSPDPKDGDDSTPGTRRSRRTRQSTAQNGRPAEEEEESDDGDEGITRCVCGNNGVCISYSRDSLLRSKLINTVLRSR